MREDVLLEDVARHLRIDAAIVGGIVRPMMRDKDTKAGSKQKQYAN